MKQRIFPLLAVVLAAAQVVLILLSWIVATVMPSSQLRSMLGGEGIRWFFGTFVDNVSSDVLVWIVLCSMAYGSFAESGLYRLIVQLCKGGNIAGRQRRAMYSALGVLVALVAVVILLAFVPHAVLLGLSGDLFPSAFSACLWNCIRKFHKRFQCVQKPVYRYSGGSSVVSYLCIGCPAVLYCKVCIPCLVVCGVNILYHSFC